MDEIEKFINGSGNNFHCKVVNYFRSKGWYAIISPYYMDGSTDKPREIDLLVEKSWFKKDPHARGGHRVNIKLFIECKYISQENVFWFDYKDLASTKRLLGNNNLDQTQHHYLSSNKKVAKLFASKNKSNSENETIYKALNQSLNSMIYLRNNTSINPDGNHEIDLVHELPVIVCNSFDNFYSVDIENSEGYQSIKNNFQMEVNYAYVDTSKSQRREFFLIDIVDFSNIDDFLQQIENDVGEILLTLEGH